MSTATDGKWQLANPPPRPPQLAPYRRPPKEPKPTRRDREMIHDAHQYMGGRAPDGGLHAVPISADEEWFRHHFWREKRARVLAALAGAGTGVNAINAFTNCGSECMIEWNHEERRYRIKANYCHSRHCEPCMRAKSNLLARNLREKLEERPDDLYRFVTLTLRHTDTPLADQIKRLYRSFTRLRAMPAWKQSQRGGAATLEVKWDPQTRKWHPHLHVICAGGYLAKESLSTAWHRATGDSFIVDIRRLDAKKDVAYYVAKYVTKGTNDAVWADADAAQEFVTATRGLRSCATFGSWRGFALLAKPADNGVWKHIGRLGPLIGRARGGCVQSIAVLEGLRETFQYNPHKPRRPKPA